MTWQHPDPLRVSHASCSRALGLRVDRVAMAIGSLRRACDVLHIGECTLIAARDLGRMQPKTMVRLLAALDAWEARQ